MRPVLSRRALAGLALALVASPAVVACSVGGSDEAESADGPRVVQPGAPGEQPNVLSPDEIEELEYPTHIDADVRFMQGMILHHAQALEMTALVPSRTARDDIPLFAKRLEISQRDEMSQMQDWLEARGEDSTHHGQHDHSSHLPGMLTAEQLAALEAATGRSFDRLFLQSMIHHHQGALAMVDELQAEGGGQEPAISTFTGHVVADQGIEIARMAGLLAQLDD